MQLSTACTGVMLTVKSQDLGGEDKRIYLVKAILGCIVSSRPAWDTRDRRMWEEQRKRGIGCVEEKQREF